MKPEVLAEFKRLLSEAKQNDYFHGGLEFFTRNHLPELLAEIERLKQENEMLASGSYCQKCGSCGETGCCGVHRCAYLNAHQGDYDDMASRLTRTEQALEVMRKGIEAVSCVEHSHYLRPDRLRHSLAAAEKILKGEA